MLNHKQVEQYLAIYRELSREERSAVEAHLANCPDCTRLAEEFRQVDTVLKQTTWKKPDPQMSAEFYEAIERDGRSWFQSAQRLSGQLAGITVLALVVLSSWLVLRNSINQAPAAIPTIDTPPTNVVVVPTTNPAETSVPVTGLDLNYTLTETVSLFSLSPEGSYLAAVDNKGIHIWHAATGKRLQTLKESSLSLDALAFTPNGVNLLGRDNNGQFHRWLAFSGAHQRTFTGAQSPVGTPFALGNTILVLVNAENDLEIWPLVGSQPNKWIETDGTPISALAVTADGQKIAAVFQDGTISIWDQSSKQLETFEAAQTAVRGMVFSDDGQKFVLYNNNAYQLFQNDSPGFTKTFEPSSNLGTILDLRFASEDQSILTGHAAGTINVWDSRTSDLVKTLNSGTAVQAAIGLTRNGFLYATLDAEGRLTIWGTTE
jgi:WD40 repeat protein